MGGINIGAFLTGAVEGYNKGRDREIEEERNVRDRERWTAEKASIDAKKVFAAETQAIEKESATGTGRFESIEKIAQPGVPAEGGAAASSNPFMRGGKGVYTNQQHADDLRYQLLAESHKKMLSVTDPDKVHMVDDTYRTMRESRLEARYAPAFLGAMNGNKAGLDDVSKLFKDLGGIEYDTSNAIWDAKNGQWTGVGASDGKGGFQPRNITTTDLASLSLFAKPHNIADHIMKAGDQVLKERGVKVEEAMLPSRIAANKASAFESTAKGQYYGVDAARLKTEAAEQKDTQLWMKFFPLEDVKPGMGEQHRLPIEARNRVSQQKMAIGKEITRVGIGPSGKPPSIEVAAEIAGLVSAGDKSRLVNQSGDKYGVRSSSGSVIYVPKSMFDK